MGATELIDRELYMARIRPFIGKPVVKVLTGVRRSGKSAMLRLVQRELTNRGVPAERFVSMNFEAFSLHDMTAAELNDRLEAHIAQGARCLFLDEIQEVEGWELVINSLQAVHDVDIYLTGSNAHFLSDEFATYLSGRYVEFKVYPFGFAEFCDLRRASGHSDTQVEAFALYRRFGGMPFLAQLDYAQDASREYLTSLYDTVLLKDIVKRNQVRDVALLERVLRYLIANMGHTFSANSIANEFAGQNIKVAPSTIAAYVEYCVRANFLCRALRQDLITKKVFTSQEKYYIVDHGFREALYGRNERNVDLVLENIVYMELLRRGYAVNVGDSGKGEVDFVAEKNGDRLYIQVAYLLASPETEAREFGAFSRLRDGYPRYVLTMDEVDFSRDGITHLNIRDFLLQ